MPFFSSFDRFQEHLDGRGLFRMDLGLDRLLGVLDRLSLPEPPCAVQVVGTNGKGSSSTFLESLARAHGLRTGLYTSPHFLSVRERILIDGRQVSEDEWLATANLVMEAGGEVLTYFELLTAMAAALFHGQGVELAVYEAGLGGTHDATTALRTHLTMVTPIAMDHAHILGDTETAIAWDKSGAFGRGRPVLSAIQSDAVRDTLARRAREVSTTCRFVPPLDSGQPLGLSGIYQRQNAALAMAAWESAASMLDRRSDPGLCSEGLATAFVPGRLQRVEEMAGVHPALLLDAAHNPHGMDSLAHHISTLQAPPPCALFACMKDKDVRGLCSRIAQLTPGPVILPQVSWQDRECPAGELAERIGPQAVQVENLERGLKMALDHAAGPESYAVLTGSLYFLAQFFTLRPDCLRPQALSSR